MESRQEEETALTGVQRELEAGHGGAVIGERDFFASRRVSLHYARWIGVKRSSARRCTRNVLS